MKFLSSLIFLVLSPIMLSQVIPPKVTTKKPINNFVEKWLNTPYKFGGESKKGIDCSALTSFFFKEVYDIKVPRTALQQYRASKKIKKSELEMGDLVFFRNNSRTGWHVGIYIDTGTFFHSSSFGGVKFSTLNDGYYKKVFYRAGRFIKDNL